MNCWCCKKQTGSGWDSKGENNEEISGILSKINCIKDDKWE